MKPSQFHQRWSASRLAYKLENARWHFFGDNPIGTMILDAADGLHKRFPKSTAVHKLWIYCLPF